MHFIFIIIYNIIIITYKSYRLFIYFVIVRIISENVPGSINSPHPFFNGTGNCTQDLVLGEQALCR